MAARQWTDEQRARQAGLIHRWKPWDRSTGARTPAGKAVSSQNVIVGLRNRQKALEQAKQELLTAVTKVHELSRARTRKAWWEYL
jgi:hypothetical protein